MSDVSQQNIKEAVIEVLEPFAQSIQKDFQEVNNRLDKMDGRFDNVDNRLDKMDGRLLNVEIGLKEVKNDVQVIKENSSELFIKLDDFISLYRKHEQELLVISHQLRNLEERVAQLEFQRQ